MENTINNNQSTEFCQQCGKHCPIDALSCGKGKSFYGVESDGEGSGHENNRKHEGHGKHEGRRNHEGHRKYEGRGGYKEDDSLLGLLRQCGHCLYHKRNGGRNLGQGKILSILLKKECMNQKDLQEELGIQPGSMSELIQKLEEKHFVERKKDESDKRKVLVSITESGKNQVMDMNEDKEEKALFAALSVEEQEALTILMKKLLSSWNTVEERQRGHRGNGHWKN